MRSIVLAVATGCCMLAWAGPAAAKNDRVMVKGTVRVKHADVFRKNLAEYWYTLKTAHGPVKLSFRGQGPTYLGGARVVVHGTRKGGMAPRLRRRRPRPLGSQARPRRRTLWEQQRLAVFLLNFTNNTTSPGRPTSSGRNTSPRRIRWPRTTRSSRSARRRSSATCSGWYTLPTTNELCDPNGFTTMANAAARAAGVNLSQYTQYQYVIGPGAPCGWAGLAYVPGTTSWVNGTIGLRVIAHEYGHNLGVHHASSLDCRNQNGQRVALSVNNLCGASEYGDPYDVMGTGMTNHMNNFHKGQLGWYDAGNMLTVTQPGNYTLAPVEGQNGGVQLIRILRNAAPLPYYFYLEYRRPFSIFDTFLPTDPEVNGVGVRIAPDLGNISQSYLIDTHALDVLLRGLSARAERVRDRSGQRHHDQDGERVVHQRDGERPVRRDASAASASAASAATSSASAASAAASASATSAASATAASASASASATASSASGEPAERADPRGNGADQPAAGVPDLERFHQQRGDRGLPHLP